MIEDSNTKLEIGKVYRGKIKSVAVFGLFIEVLPGKEGLCHISELLQSGPNALQNYKIGEMIDVKVLDINMKGQIKLTEKIK